jgi:hypothetical protein
MTMASLFSRVSQFAKSKQGKDLIDKGKDFASKPGNRRTITKLFSSGADDKGGGRRAARKRRR